MTVSEWHKIKNDGDPWQPTCWLQMAHNDDNDDEVVLQYTRSEVNHVFGIGLYMAPINMLLHVGYIKG